MNVRDYLQRIGIVGEVRSDLAALRHIQERHMLAVPYENLDIWYGRPIELALPALYDKIVRRRRGGYCYELNGLAAWLLERLGYRVSILSGQVARSEGGFGPDFDHMLLLVDLDRPFIVDVGFGDSARWPLALTGEVLTDVSGSYRIVAEPGTGALLLQKHGAGAGWDSRLRFTLRPRRLCDFAAMNTWQQTAPESDFTRRCTCSLATPTGRISISGDTWIETRGADKVKRPLHSAEERRELFRRHFGIDIDAVARLAAGGRGGGGPGTPGPPAGN